MQYNILIPCLHNVNFVQTRYQYPRKAIFQEWQLPYRLYEPNHLLQ
ncbi:hypothetical protein HMPREF9446_00633 [Bacteroides fluxus YIT 12057]|uniref:Uncharacterized protein n=1 Tax=Bacteroides fluxus YIT 12057 TaxID=763034 RepID=F3PPN6_9BACE|nr:hypothetical protein HMPREF9446_00633 [Bacteroides fluxus YIT 12057]